MKILYNLPILTIFDIIYLLAIGAIILLITTELSFSGYGLTNLMINWKNLRNATVISTVFFIVVATLEIGIQVLQ